MVGDDLDTDVRAAQRAGLRGVFVLTGKHTRADVEAPERPSAAARISSRNRWATWSPR